MRIVERIMDLAGWHEHRWEPIYPQRPAEGLRCRCGERVVSEFGPPGEVHGSYRMDGADGPNCGWFSAEERERRRLAWEEREREDAKWRTRYGHDIALAGEHWVRVCMFRGGWPNFNPGDRPSYVWACRRCGEEFEQQVASTFHVGTGPSGPTVYGVADEFSRPGGLQIEGDRVLFQRIEHLRSHGVDVEPILADRREAQRQIELRMSGVTCQMAPAEIARMSMVFEP